MEDAHTTKLDLDEDKPESDSNAFFAVYDGHGGWRTAEHASKSVYKRLVQEEAYAQGDFGNAFKKAFIDTDAEMRDDPTVRVRNDNSGCTAVAGLLTTDGRVVIANAGDSRAVLSSKGVAKPLSNDHKPQLDSERKRIVAAGGYIEYGRVNGNLALSRALGDFDYKKNPKLGPEAQIITCDPEIMEHQITEDDEFLIIACDGIWDCLSSQQAVDIIRLLISRKFTLQMVGEKICDHCLAPETAGGTSIGCDNMTIMIVALLHGRTLDEWQAWVTDRVMNNIPHQVPDILPQLYSVEKLARFERLMQMFEERERREEEDQKNRGQVDWRTRSNQQVLGSTGGISIQPGSSLLANTASLIFGNAIDDDDDDDNMDEEEFISLKGIENIPEEKESQEIRDAALGISGSPKVTPALQGEAPPPPQDGEAPKQPEPLPEQHHSEPGGDAPSDAVRAEGLSDKSEDPMIVS